MRKQFLIHVISATISFYLQSNVHFLIVHTFSDTHPYASYTETAECRIAGLKASKG